MEVRGGVWQTGAPIRDTSQTNIRLSFPGQRAAMVWQICVSELVLMVRKNTQTKRSNQSNILVIRHEDAAPIRISLYFNVSIFLKGRGGCPLNILK